MPKTTSAKTRFGRPGLRPFLGHFPWLLVLIAGGAILAGLRLLKKLDLSYRHNFIVIATITIISIVGAGLVIDGIGVNQHLARKGPIKSFYKQRMPDSNWIMGEIIEVKSMPCGETLPDGNQVLRGRGLKVKSLEGQELIVILHETTHLPMGRNFKTGQLIRAFGKKQNGTFDANSRFFPLPSPHPAFRLRSKFSR